MAKNYNVRIDLNQMNRIEDLIKQLDPNKSSLHYGGNPSLSLFLQALADGKLSISKTWSKEELKLLLDAFLMLQASQIAYPTTSVASVIEKSELQSDRLDEMKKRILRQPVTEVELQIDNFIQSGKPFRIIDYLDVMSKTWSFNCYWANWWDSGDGVLRLRCWCEETENNTDIPQLQHNWNFVPARSPNVQVIPIAEEWRDEGLNSVESQLLFFGGMASAYSSHRDDERTGVLEDHLGETVLRVKRQVWSSFWLFKDLAPYIDLVAIAAPNELAVLWEKKLNKIHELQQSLITKSY